MDNMEATIDKIKKLLALSTSNNESEASIALAKAYSLLTKHNIDINSIHDEEEKIIDVPYMESRKIRQWKISLLIEIANTTYCQAYRNIAFDENNHIDTQLINLVGTEVNVKACTLMADYIFHAIEYQTKNLMTGKGKQVIESFKVGFATTIVERLKMMKAVNNNPDCKELVIVQDKKVSDYMNQMKLTKSIVDVSIEDINSYVQGRKKGEELSLNKQINANSTMLLKGV